MTAISRKALAAIVPFYFASIAAAQASGTGTTTRYWDCCKPSCAWPGKTTLASGATPVKMCDISGSTLTDFNAVSGCSSGGTAFMPASESPWAINEDLAYGYAAVNIAGGTEDSWCCGCYELTFTSGAVAGKKMVVQATNTGSDLAGNQFDIAIPGGGVGIYNGCSTQWGAPSSGWGAQYGGISSRADCANFPTELQAGCEWRFDWFGGSDNPGVTYKQVTCPAALTAKTGCVRAGEIPTGSESASSAAPVVASSSPPVAETAPVAAEVLNSPTSITSSSSVEPTTTISSETTTYTTVTIYPGSATRETVASGTPEAAVQAPVVAAVAPASSDVSTTLTIYTVQPKTTNGQVVTETIALTTTVCPVTAAEGISSSIVASASIASASVSIPAVVVQPVFSAPASVPVVVAPSTSSEANSPVTSSGPVAPIISSIPVIPVGVAQSSAAASSTAIEQNSPEFGSMSSNGPVPSLYSAHSSESYSSTVTVYESCSTTSSVEAVVTTTIYHKC